ncbi:Uncharacterised protein [Neisseria zoodegmatis]|uniref:Uncharacterized protein n=1 Tax=Neisseria zoodegmatis TaxID=326523 RepID=A0A378WS18_9NEIS|nr:hypothetical protein [Neisseria zoodegmatis]MDO5069767.1 hypothetical protein [Neisseria zoodegmatis]SUA44150.1 Uncharacterised protein [Neisseria zoodegmatis]
MSEQTQDLRELLVIHKARNPNPMISTKSILIFTVTWALWFLTAYLILRDHQTLIYRPVVGTWALSDLAKIAAVIVLVQLNILLVWSIFTVRKPKK